ncbi:MAG: hypothetical protein R3F05_11810 [Planctomycetota bacterium]
MTKAGATVRHDNTTSTSVNVLAITRRSSGSCNTYAKPSRSSIHALRRGGASGSRST